MEWPDAVNLLAHWRDHPPASESSHVLQLLIADFLGAKPKDEALLDAEADTVVNTVSSSDFAALLKQHGLPVGDSA